MLFSYLSETLFSLCFSLRSTPSSVSSISLLPFIGCRCLLIILLYRNNLLSDCSNFKCACVTYVTYGDIISNEVHYRLVIELASLAQHMNFLTTILKIPVILVRNDSISSRIKGKDHNCRTATYKQHVY